MEENGFSQLKYILGASFLSTLSMEKTWKGMEMVVDVISELKSISRLKIF